MTARTNLTAIVLAAGASVRFGSSKQLFVFEGEPLVRRAVRTALDVAPVILVVPSGRDEHSSGRAIREAVAGLLVTIVENEMAKEGIASSIRAGVAACRGDVLLTLCDQPHVGSDHLRLLASAGGSIVATGYAGTVGAPARFAASLRHELLSLHGDRGARTLFERHESELVTIPFELAAIDLDVRPN